MKQLIALALTACSTQGGSHNGADDAMHPPGDGAPPGDAPPAITTSDLRFAIVGDTRPKYPDDTPNYPTPIITKIWQDVAAESPVPQFAVTTGDYMFAKTYTSHQQEQLDLYMGARAAFSGPLYPTLGNHECNGSTDSNCGAGHTDGVTANYTAFMTTMLAPIGESNPYYERRFAATDGSWTAKLVVIACNAWDQTQASWLDTTLAAATTYTFVARHQNSTATTGPCVTPSATIMANHPLTLLIDGHAHSLYRAAYNKELVVGIGGAPLTTGTNYGYVIVARDATGRLVVTAYDYMTHATLLAFTINADGSGA